MKQNLNEEIAKMRTIMGLEEQFLKGLGDKLKNGINQLSQPHQNAQEAPTKGKTYEEIRAEYSKVNSDMTNMRGFGEGKSREMSLAVQQAEFNARVAIMKKMGVNNAQFGSTIYYGENDEYKPRTFMTKDGVYNHLVIMEKTD